jgi:hypothetical protein
MARRTTPVHLTHGDAGKADARTFGAPDRPVPVPYAHRRAGNGLAHGDDLAAMARIIAAIPSRVAIPSAGAGTFDNFGTGYASLNRLKNYPISHIKIDKSFIWRTLSLKVSAEGVETDAQRAFLQAQCCEEARGYLFRKPMAAGLFAEKFVMTGFGARAVS